LAFDSLDFGLREFGVKNVEQRLAHYRGYVYDKGGLRDKQENKPLPVKKKDRFRYRCRYFIDGGVIGSREYVRRIYLQFKDIFQSRKEKKPLPIAGLNSVYSLKRLTE